MKELFLTTASIAVPWLLLCLAVWIASKREALRQFGGRVLCWLGFHGTPIIDEQHSDHAIGHCARCGDSFVKTEVSGVRYH